MKTKTYIAIAFGVLLTALAACGGGGTASKPTTAPVAASSKTSQTAPKAAAAPQANNAKSDAECTALFKANTHFGYGIAEMVNLTPDTNYDGLTDPSSPVYLDFPRLNSDLDTLATMPESSDSISYFRQLVTLSEADVKAKGKPFNDKIAGGEKLIGIDTPWGLKIVALQEAMSVACRDFTMPTDTPTPN